MQILKNGNILTLNPQQPKVQALAIHNRRIFAIGSNEDIEPLAKSKSKIIDLQGRAVLPGLTDAHIHLEHTAKSLAMVDCETDTLAECLNRIRQRISTTPPGEWVLGHGWNQNSWTEGYGTNRHLDELSTQHPIFLTAKSLHASWANTKALEMAGITAHTPDPEGGSIGHFPDGALNGLLFENAMWLPGEVIPPTTQQKLIEILEQTQKKLWELGITAVHDFDGAACFNALQTMDTQDRLRLRVVKSIPHANLDAAVQVGLRTGFGSEFLKVGSLKLFADGALGPHTAAMLAPYEDDPHNRGVLLLSEEEIFHYGQMAAKSGLSLSIHAIGDLANQEVLNGYERLRAFETENQLPALSHRIEHVQVLSPQDLHRLAQMKVVASVQPIHLSSDMFVADRYWGKRSELAYAFGSLIQHGTQVIFGSDSPVESPNPFWGMAAAVSRRNMQGQPDQQGWYPSERIELAAALRAYTTTPARIAGWENSIGQLSRCYAADLIVLDQNPFDISTELLKDLLPTGVMVAGDWVIPLEL
jgi:predicted amidohydrolase YtcJ